MPDTTEKLCLYVVSTCIDQLLVVKQTILENLIKHFMHLSFIDLGKSLSSHFFCGAIFSGPDCLVDGTATPFLVADEVFKVAQV